MHVSYNAFSAISNLFGGIFGGSQPPYASPPQAANFNSGPSAADAKAKADSAAEQSKRTSLADQANRTGAANSLLTSTDNGSEFSDLKTRKTLLGGA